MDWIESGLDVRYDADFMAQVLDHIQSNGTLVKMVDAHAYRADMVANMDY